MPPKSERERRCLAELRLATAHEENDRLRRELRDKTKELEDRALRAEDEVFYLKRELDSARASLAILKALE